MSEALRCRRRRRRWPLPYSKSTHQLLVEINKLYLVSTNGECMERWIGGAEEFSVIIQGRKFFFFFGSLERRIIGW